MQRVWYRERPARSHRDTGARQRAHDLERVERIAAGGVENLSQERARQRDAEMRMYELVERGGVERTDLEVDESLGRPRMTQLFDERALDACPAGQERANVLDARRRVA